MSDYELVLWLLASAAGLLICGLFAGLETGIYCLNRVRLHLLSHQGNRSARTLSALVDKPASLLATLLVGTNIATNLATSAMGVVFHARFTSDWQIIVAVVLIETPLLFVFAEILPKDLFAAHADRLVYWFVSPMLWCKRLFTAVGVLPLIALVGHIAMKGLGTSLPVKAFGPRRQMAALVREGLGQGLLSDQQTAIVERVISLADRSVRDEMVPWLQVTTVKVDDTPAHLRSLADQVGRSRYPVIDDSGRAIGVVNVVDVLLADWPQ